MIKKHTFLKYTGGKYHAFLTINKYYDSPSFDFPGFFFAFVLLSVSSFSFCDLSRTRPGVSRKGPIDVYIYIYNTVDG